MARLQLRARTAPGTTCSSRSRADGLTLDARRRGSRSAPATTSSTGLAADPVRPGRVAVAYYAESRGKLDVRLVRSVDGGATWSRPLLLSPERMPFGRIAFSKRGHGRRLHLDVVRGRARGRRVHARAGQAAGPPPAGDLRELSRDPVTCGHLIDPIWNAVEVFWGRLDDLGWGALLLGIAFHVLRLWRSAARGATSSRRPTRRSPFAGGRSSAPSSRASASTRSCPRAAATSSASFSRSRASRGAATPRSPRRSSC